MPLASAASSLASIATDHTAHSASVPGKRKAVLSTFSPMRVLTNPLGVALVVSVCDPPPLRYGFRLVLDVKIAQAWCHVLIAAAVVVPTCDDEPPQRSD